MAPNFLAWSHIQASCNKREELLFPPQRFTHITQFSDARLEGITTLICLLVRRLSRRSFLREHICHGTRILTFSFLISFCGGRLPNWKTSAFHWLDYWIITNYPLYFISYPFLIDDMKRSTANGRNSVARIPHALNRCIDNCTSAEDLMPQLRPRERSGGIGLGE
jgi:hypothetical protein